MKIVFLRTNRIDPDPRVEKEINSLLTVPEFDIKAVVWDRTDKYSRRVRKLNFYNGEVPVIQFGIPASWGGGMKVNFKSSIIFEWKLFWWLIVNNKNYDCIHACDLLTGMPALLPAKLFRKKLVYDIFDYYAATTRGPEFILKIFATMENLVINHADATIICSEKRKEQIAKSNPKKLIVCHNAPSSDQIISRNKKFRLQSNANSSNRIKIAYVGNLVENRYILQALSLADSLPDVEFHIGGMGILAEKISLMANSKDNIFFYGKMNYQDVLSLEEQSDILLALYDPRVNNHKYAAPNKFYEALSLGKPLIMFHSTGMDEVIEKYHIGAVCDATEEGIYSAICQLINEKNQWPTMSTRMKKLFGECYSWDIMEGRLRSLYRELISYES